MHILTMLVGEGLRIGDDVEIRVLRCGGSQVRLGIEAPKQVKVHREEVYIQEQEKKRNCKQLQVKVGSGDAGESQ